MKHHLVACPTCGSVQELSNPARPGQWICPRCGEVLLKIRENARVRTIAFALAALFLYVPANIYPLIIMQYLGRETENTVWGGVQALYESHMWPIAVLVFFASILIPLLKLLGLLYLVVDRSSRQQRLRTRIYRIICRIGPWAMLDVFLLAIMVALIRFGQFASVVPGPGILAFSAMVILTLLASASFDPHLIWKEEASASSAK